MSCNSYGERNVSLVGFRQSTKFLTKRPLDTLLGLRQQIMTLVRANTSLRFVTSLSLLAFLVIGEACTSRSAVSPPETRLVLKSKAIIKGVVRIDAGKSVSYRLDVEPEMLDASVKGSFRAAGGSGNDVQVAIGDEMNITNWVNGHQASVLWETPGQLTTGVFDVSLKPGTYFLVISNRFSMFAEKTVEVESNLSYQQNEPVKVR